MLIDVFLEAELFLRTFYVHVRGRYVRARPLSRRRMVVCEIVIFILIHARGGYFWTHTHCISRRMVVLEYFHERLPERVILHI